MTKGKIKKIQIDKYKILFDNLADSAVLADLTGKIVDINKTGLSFFGYSKKEILKHVVSDLHPEYTRDRVRHIFRDLVTNRKNGIVEVDIITRHKKIKPIALNASRVTLDGQDYIIGIFRDLRKRTVSELHYRILSEFAKDCVYLFNRQGALIYVNKFGAKRHDSKPEDLIGKNIINLFPWSVAKEQKDRLKKVFKTGRTESFEKPVVFSGKNCWLSTQLTAIKDKEGHVESVLNVSREVTKKHESEEEIKKKKSLLDSITTASLEGILVIDGQGKVIFYNDRFIKLWNIPAELIALKDDRKLLNFVLNQLKDPKEFLAKVKYLYSRPKLISLDNIEFKDGRVFVRTSIPQKTEGKVVGRVWRFSDITARVQSERKLVESEKKFRNIFNNAEIGMFRTRLDGSEILDMNERYLEIVGYTRSEMLGKPSRNYWVDSAERRQMVHLLKTTGRVVDFEARMLNKKGEIKTCLVTTILYPKEGILEGSIQDITTRKKTEEALALSEQKYRRLFEAAKDGILILDAETGEIREVNPYLIEMLGYTHKEFLQKKLWEIGLFRDIVASKKSFEVLKNKKYVHYENLPLQTKTGQTKNVEFVSNVYKIDHSDVVQCNIRDITARHMAEEALANNEARLRAIHENSPVSIILSSLDGQFIEANPAAVKLWGYSEAELKKINFNDITYPEDVKSGVLQNKQLIRGKIKMYQVDKRFIRKDGRTIFARVNVSLIRDDKKKPLYFLTNIEDITDRKRWEKMISDSEKKYSTLVEKSSDGVLVIQGGFIKFANKTIQDMTGYKISEVLDKPMLDFIADKYKKMVAERYTKRLKGLSVPSRYEFELLPKSRKELFVEINSSLIEFEGQPAVMSLIRDVTRNKQIDRIKTEFVSIASHQLRTPLTGIKWFSQLLLAQKAGSLSDKQLDFIQQIYDSNERMIHLVNDLMDVSHIETEQKFVIEKKSGDIMSLIKNVVSEQRINVKNSGMSIEISRNCPQKFIFSFDYNKLYQVFSNLIDNSIKYSGKNKKIIIDVKQEKNEVFFSVQDFGLGIPEYQKKSIFQKFFRGDNIAKVSAEGTGLGLYIVKGIIEAHGGKIWFESEENQGTTFNFTLPLRNKKQTV